MYRNATQEEIKRIKEGEYFLVKDYHDTKKIYKFIAAHNSSCSNGRWYVPVKTMCLDTKTGLLVEAGGASFGEGRIVIEE